MIIQHVPHPQLVHVVVMYIGPDQIMPLTSALSAVVGVALMFWTRLAGLVHKCRTMLSRRTETPQKPSAERNAD